MDERIRMDTAGGSDGPSRRAGARRPAVLVIVAVAVTAFGLLTTLAPDRDAREPETIDPAALVEPAMDAGFRIVAELTEGPWEPFRIAGGYLFVGDDLKVITDDDVVVEVELPDLEVLFGAIDAGGESVAFGSAPDGPALWRSPDGISWTLERLPWDGTVRAGAFIGGRLVLIGIERIGPSFHYVAATEAPGRWLVVETNRIPDSGLISVPGGFVGRGSATDGSGFGYLFSDTGVDWAYQSDRAAAGARYAGEIPSFVLEGGDTQLLTLPGDDRVFAPPAWPISRIWIEGETIWIQTPDSAWASRDGVDWDEFPIDATTGVPGGFSILLPVGDTPRLATARDDRVFLLRWDAGTS